MKLLAGRFLVVASLLLFGTQACNTDQLPPAAGSASVSGTILDATTNAPIAGALVTMDTVLTATTDATGHFSIDKVPSGIADYAISAKGYKPLTSSTNIEPGKPFQLNVTLTQQPAQ